MEGWRVLVVEDDFLVAQVLMDVLEEAGAVVLGPFGWLDEALDYVTRNGPLIDCAILDLNLHGAKSYPIADALAACNVPFTFATGYGADAVERAYAGYPRCQKPFSTTALLAALTPRPA